MGSVGSRADAAEGNRLTSIPKRKLYGRKKTRAMGWERQAAIDALLPKLSIPVADGAIDISELFPFKPDQLWLEIGFGNGEHVAELMRRHPERGYIAVEPFITGMAAFLTQIVDEPHENVRVWMDDALLLCPRLPAQCLDGIYILNPDPWPKSRHEKRRVAGRENLDEFARLLKPCGQLIMATDHATLADWMTIEATNHSAFEWTAEKADDWRTAPADWVRTRYEVKGADAGRTQTYLFFQRR